MFEHPRKEEENGRGREEDVGGHSARSYPSFCSEQTLGAEGSEGGDGDEMFSQSESLLPSTFPQRGRNPSTSPTRPRRFSFLLHHHRLHRRGGGGMARGEGGEERVETRQDRGL